MNFGVLAYGTSAATFLLLTILLVAGWQGRRQSTRLIVASLLTTGWAGLLVAQATNNGNSLAPIYIGEIIRGGSWLIAIMGIASGAVPRFLRLIVNSLWVGVLIILLLALFRPFVDPALIFSRGALAIAVIGLVLLEQAYRNADPANKPALKYLLLGLGGLFAYDVFLYSEAELIHGIEPNAWYVRGLANAVCVPLIALGIRHNPDKPFTLFVSRHVVFHTMALTGIGGYLVLMALGGYYVRGAGGTWGRLAEVLFMIAALGVLVSLVFSGQLRRRLSVFIAKHFYRNKYDYRIEWLRFIRTLSENEGGDVKRTAVRAVSQIFESPGGILLTADETRRYFTPVAAWPLTLSSIPGLAEVDADHDLTGFLLHRHWIIDLEEYRRSPEVYDNIRIPEWIVGIPTLRIVSPMIELDRLMGFFLLYDPPPPFRLTYEDRDLLKTVGQHVATQIGQHEADRKLAEGRQFEAYNKLTAFMMHDLKNSVAQLQLLVSNAERHKNDPAFIEDAFSTVANAAGRMTHLIEHVTATNSQPRLKVVAFDRLVESAIARCTDRFPVPKLALMSAGITVRSDPERLGSIIEHVIRNAQDASDPDQPVDVDAEVSGREVILTVSDHGSGMSPEFVRDRLFRPFDSTKGSKGMGIGAYQAREYVRLLGGDVKVQSSPGSGTRFSIMLPVSSSDA